MIRRLRVRHRRMIPVLAGIAFLGVAAALLARQPPPRLVALPAALQPPTSAVLEQASSSQTLDLQGLKMKASLHTSELGARALILEAEGDPASPELLVYWSLSGAEVGSTLPANAVLLGAAGQDEGEFLPLPGALGGGHLLLYSLAHQEVAGRAALPPRESAPTPLAGGVGQAGVAPDPAPASKPASEGGE